MKHVVFSVRVFKCGHMASNCGRCRSVDVRHGCGWCTGSKRCSIRERCREGSWLGRDQPCPNPSIDQVSLNLPDLSLHVDMFIDICKMKKWPRLYETFWNMLLFYHFLFFLFALCNLGFSFQCLAILRAILFLSCAITLQAPLSSFVEEAVYKLIHVLIITITKSIIVNVNIIRLWCHFFSLDCRG